MADDTPTPARMATGTAALIAGGTVKILTPFALALGDWLSRHTGIVFPEGYGADLMEWALLMASVGTAYWHAKP